MAANHPGKSGSARNSRSRAKANTHPTIAAAIGLDGSSIREATQSNNATTSAAITAEDQAEKTDASITTGSPSSRPATGSRSR
jgi:hypothetical protein